MSIQIFIAVDPLLALEDLACPAIKLYKYKCMNFNLLTDKWSISGDKSVNYIAKFIKN